MKKNSFLKIRYLILVYFFVASVIAQEKDNIDDSESKAFYRKSKFLTGIYVGSYFANKYSASTYDGYGFDSYGNRNTFTNSFMYQKIINEYGGGYGQRDYIAEAIGVDQKQWTFSESDMPFNMRYTPAILVGANFKIPLTTKNSLIVNVNGTKLNIGGNFTIGTLKPNNPNPLINTNVQTFSIRGGEQRLLFQLGFQQTFGEDDKFNFLFEAGLNGTLAKFDKNVIYINDLTIDLTYYVNQTANPAPFPSRRPLGFAMGAFFGAGANIDVSDKFIIQMLWSPSLEKVNIGSNPKLKFQNAVGLRAYYKLIKAR